jgi:hypothetical protein
MRTPEGRRTMKKTALKKMPAKTAMADKLAMVAANKSNMVPTKKTVAKKSAAKKYGVR